MNLEDFFKESNTNLYNLEKPRMPFWETLLEWVRAKVCLDGFCYTWIDESRRRISSLEIWRAMNQFGGILCGFFLFFPHDSWRVESSGLSLLPEDASTTTTSFASTVSWRTSVTDVADSSRNSDVVEILFSDIFLVWICDKERMPIEFWTLNLNVSLFELEITGLRLYDSESTLGEADKAKLWNFNENIHTYLKSDKWRFLVSEQCLILIS